MRDFTRDELVSKKVLCIDYRGARVTVGKSKTLSAASNSSSGDRCGAEGPTCHPGSIGGGPGGPFHGLDSNKDIAKLHDSASSTHSHS
jgi:hypothetical protein